MYVSFLIVVLLSKALKLTVLSGLPMIPELYVNSTVLLENPYQIMTRLLFTSCLSLNQEAFHQPASLGTTHQGLRRDEHTVRAQGWELSKAFLHYREFCRPLFGTSCQA